MTGKSATSYDPQLRYMHQHLERLNINSTIILGRQDLSKYRVCCFLNLRHVTFTLQTDTAEFTKVFGFDSSVPGGMSGARLQTLWGLRSERCMHVRHRLRSVTVEETRSVINGSRKTFLITMNLTQATEACGHAQHMRYRLESWDRSISEKSSKVAHWIHVRAKAGQKKVKDKLRWRSFHHMRKAREPMTRGRRDAFGQEDAEPYQPKSPLPRITEEEVEE